MKDDSTNISESASYEDGAGESTVVIDGSGEDQASATASKAGKTKIIPLDLDKQTIVNSQYEANTNAALYRI